MRFKSYLLMESAAFVLQCYPPIWSPNIQLYGMCVGGGGGGVPQNNDGSRGTTVL